MKKLFFVMSALAALTLLAPSTGFAARADNQFGIYSEAAAGPGTQNFSVTPNVPFFAYLVLTEPVDNDGAPIPQIEAFECKITFSNGVSIFKLAETLPPQAINVGDSSNPAAGLDYAVGLGVPVDVVAGNVTLVQFQFLALVGTQIDVFVEQSTTGNIYYQEAEGKTLVDAYPSSGDTSLPVASFNGIVTATDEETWGGVKALYR